MSHPGTVFDIGYQTYTGTREGRSRGRRAVWKDGVRIALGLGRGARAKLLPWAFIIILSFIALIMAFIAGAAERMAGPGATERLNLPTHGDYYSIAVLIIMLLSAIGAPELLCRDRREGTINLYLVRPITAGDYVLGRWLAFLTVTTLAAWLPQFILLAGLAGGDPDPVQYLRQHWLDLPRFLVAGLAMAAYATTLSMLVASFTTRRAYASVFLIGLVTISMPFTNGLAAEFGEHALGQWLSMFSLVNVPLYVNDVVFGEPSVLTRSAPAGKVFTGASLVAWYLAWLAVPGAVLWWRYQRLAA